MATWGLREAMNASAAPAPADVDEFALAGLAAEPSALVRPPRVAESPVHLELRSGERDDAPSVDAEHPNTVVFGEVKGIHIADRAIEDGMVRSTGSTSSGGSAIATMSASTTRSAWTAPAGRDRARRVTALTARGLACRRGGRTVFSGLWFLAPPRRRAGAARAQRRRQDERAARAGGAVAASRRIALVARARRLRRRRRLAAVSAHAGHLDAVKPPLTVAENVSFQTLIAGGESRRVGAALAAFGLAELADVPARFLSAGQRRRVGLAFLVAAPAPVWLLDEPAAGLDGDATAALAAVMAGHRAGGGVVVAATHVDLGLTAAETLRLDS